MSNSPIMIIVVVILVIDFFGIVGSFCFLLGKLSDIFGFDNAKETYAKVVRFETFGDSERIGNAGTVTWTDYEPVLGFFNEFNNTYEEKCKYGVGVLSKIDDQSKKKIKEKMKVGDEVKIQYTDKKIRIVDENYVKSNKYNFRYCAMPLIIFSIIGIICFIILGILIMNGVN